VDQEDHPAFLEQHITSLVVAVAVATCRTMQVTPLVEDVVAEAVEAAVELLATVQQVQAVALL
jgi:hypothetical protein